MTRRNSNRRQSGRPPQAPSHPTRSKRLAWVAGILLALAVAAAGVWFWIEGRTARVPDIGLANLDAGVARLIQKHLDEVRARPRSAGAWGNLGLVLRAYDFVAPSRQCLAEAERLDSRNPRWPYFRSLLLNTEQPVEALTHLRRTVQLCGNDPEMPRLRLATILAEDGKWEESEREIQELLRAKPDFTPGWLLRARRAQAQGNIAEGINLARRCIEDPRTARAAVVLLAALYARQGETNSASQLSRRIPSLPSDEPVADTYQAEAARLRQDPRILTEQTHPLLAAGRLKEAEANIQQLIRRHSDYAETWLLVGRFQLLTKDLNSAEQSLRRHLQLDPQSSQGWFQLGLVQLAQERFPEAAQTFLKATELKPDFGPAFYNRGFALARSGDLRGAMPLFREAIRHNPERIDSYLMLAEVYLRLGDRTEALKLLHQAEALNPSHPGLRKLREKARQLGEVKSPNGPRLNHTTLAGSGWQQ